MIDSLNLLITTMRMTYISDLVIGLAGLIALNPTGGFGEYHLKIFIILPIRYAVVLVFFQGQILVSCITLIVSYYYNIDYP